LRRRPDPLTGRLADRQPALAPASSMRAWSCRRTGASWPRSRGRAWTPLSEIPAVPARRQFHPWRGSGSVPDQRQVADDHV